LNNQEKLFSGLAFPKAEWVSLAGDELSYEGDVSGYRQWRFADGDTVGVFFFDLKPDLPRAASLAQFLPGIRRSHRRGEPAWWSVKSPTSPGLRPSGRS
jgi:hypothetical protein